MLEVALGATSMRVALFVRVGNSLCMKMDLRMAIGALGSRFEFCAPGR